MNRNFLRLSFLLISFSVSSPSFADDDSILSKEIASTSNNKSDIELDEVAFDSKKNLSNIEPLDSMKIDSYEFEIDGFLLGAYVDGKWVSYDDLQNNRLYHFFRIWGGEEWTTLTWNKINGTGVGSAIDQDHAEEGDGSVLPDTATLSVHTTNDQIWSGLAIKGSKSFDPFPRKYVRMAVRDKAPEVYKSLVKDVLKTKPETASASVDIRQLFKGDFDGDGVDEVIITASNVRDEQADWDVAAGFPDSSNKFGQKDGYSLILYRRIVNGKVVQTPLYFVTSKDGFGDTLPACSAKIAMIADLNNDGIMEIILNTMYYEGIFYKLINPKTGEEIPEVGGGWGA